MTNKSICKNAWCRATYTFEGDMPPGECPKCKSFHTELSAGVTWKDKTYTESRNDGKAHETRFVEKRYGS